MDKIKAIALLCILVSCSTPDYRYKVTGQVQVKADTSPATWYTHKLSYKGDTAYYTNSDSSVVNILPPYKVEQLEKHFPCTVDDIMMATGIEGYITECGVFFESRQVYKIGDTIKNFKSPKHK